MANQKVIKSTKNYRLFARSADNRPLDLAKHRKLMKSMQMYGFLKCFPVVVSRDTKSQTWIIKDGQHRVAIAEELGLAVHYVEDDADFDVAVVNSTPKTWQTRDYAEMYAAKGMDVYIEGLRFADKYKLPVGDAFALLSGTIRFGNVQDAFKDGAFQIKDREYADVVASTYSAICNLSRECRNTSFFNACAAAARVDGFQPERLIAGARQCRDKLVAYSTRDAYLDMIEQLYNFRRRQLTPIKLPAQQVMRERNVRHPKNKSA